MAVTTEKCGRCAKTTVWICFFECLFIAFFKLVIGFTSGSKAMLGSALYSVTDLVSAFLLIVSSRVSARPPDAGHPYGHGKIEHLVSLLISLIVLVGTVALLVISTFTLYKVDMQPLHWIGVWASLACLCLNHIIYKLVICAARETRSPAMMTHATHVRLDSISNIAVILAIIAAEIGFPELDPVIAIIEAVHVLFESSKVVRRSAAQLMDASISDEYAGAVRDLISQSPDVKAVTDIKGRCSGSGISLDVEILMDGSRKIEDCNATVRILEGLIRKKMDGATNVNVHYHPYGETEV